jgi:SAM-dependent methyltransferase
VGKVNTWTDRASLRRQYGDPGNLATRVGLYAYLVDEGGLGARSFQEWVLDHVDWSSTEAVLDVGRGGGSYEPALRERAGWVVGLDLSPGMLARPGPLAPPRLVVGDAQCLPVARGAFDIVLAAHMLYHVPDIGRAVVELRRVLRPRGTALLVANGAADKREIRTLWAEAVAAVGPPSFRLDAWVGRFDVDAAPRVVEEVFDDVRVDILDGEFRFPSPDPVVAWVNSLRPGTEDVITDEAWAAVADDLRARIQHRIDEDGAFVVHKSSGVLVAR